MEKVLVVDDCDDVRCLLELCITAAGYDVVQAENGRQALEISGKLNPSVIILDVMMPEMNGIEVCERIREESAGVVQPYIIMLSVRGETADKVAGLGIGADSYLSKPFDPEELVAHIRVGLRIHEERANAFYDPLTRLFNRRGLERILAREIDRRHRHNSPLSFVMMDLDKFKSVNDTFGHSAGDAVIETFAELLQTTSRDCDFPFRWGGEEFALILADTNLQGATRVAERLRDAVERHEFPQVKSMTCSFGVAEHLAGETMDSLFHRTDAALYRAKLDGRNAVRPSDVVPLSKQAV